MLSSIVKFFVTALPFLQQPIDIQTSKCTNPLERKEWRALSLGERVEWISAVKCLANVPHDDALTATDKPPYAPPINESSSYYDDLVYLHIDLGEIVHATGFFLPWHRNLVHVFETALRTKCGFTGATPYWDWTLDVADFPNSPIFSGDPDSGLGGWGDPSADYRVMDGAFSASSSFELAYDFSHTLRRQYEPFPFHDYDFPGYGIIPMLPGNETIAPAEVTKLVNGFQSDFKGFQSHLEAIQGVHMTVHNMVGGDLAGVCWGEAPKECISSRASTPNDPLFWLHHAMVDKIWFDWQRKHESNARAFEGGSVPAITNLEMYKKYPNGAPPKLTLDSVLPSDGMFPRLTINDVASTTGDNYCYVYV